MSNVAVLNPKDSQVIYNSTDFSQIISNLESILKGKHQVIEYSLACLIARGHVLFEDLPGTGKTSLARGFAQLLGGDFSRIQMTSDLLPSDVVGHLRMNPKTKDLEFRKGPVFCNFLLADELNRTSPKTQGALLEAMEEKTVTIDGTSYPLPNPFFVLATQNPMESFGVYPLPESQLDRFMMLLSIGFPSENEESVIYQTQNLNLPTVDQKYDLNQLTHWQLQAEKVHCDESVIDFITKINRTTRDHSQIRSGISIRGGLQFLAALKALAFVRGREFIKPSDVKELAPHVLAHRLALESGSHTLSDKKDCLNDILEEIPAPK